MDTIGARWWLTRQRAQDGETVMWDVAANHTQHTSWVGDIAIGGRLYLTNQRLLFNPHHFNFGIGNQWATALQEIGAVTKQPKARTLSNIWSGGMRDRLRVTLRNGTVQLLVVPHLDEAITRLQAAIASE